MEAERTNGETLIWVQSLKGYRQATLEKCTDVPVEKCQQVPEQKCTQVGTIMFIKGFPVWFPAQALVQKCWDEPKEHCTEKTVGFW